MGSNWNSFVNWLRRPFAAKLPHQNLDEGPKAIVPVDRSRPPSAGSSADNPDKDNPSNDAGNLPAASTSPLEELQHPVEEQQSPEITRANDQADELVNPVEEQQPPEITRADDREFGEINQRLQTLVEVTQGASPVHGSTFDGNAARMMASNSIDTALADQLRALTEMLMQMSALWKENMEASGKRRSVSTERKQARASKRARQRNRRQRAKKQSLKAEDDDIVVAVGLTQGNVLPWNIKRQLVKDLFGFAVLYGILSIFHCVMPFVPWLEVDWQKILGTFLLILATAVAICVLTNNRFK